MPGEKTPLVGFAGDDAPAKKRGRGLICVVVILVLLLIIFIALSVTFIVLYATSSKTANELPCITSTCISLTQEILSSIDETRSPCNDFYNFTCGHWERTHALEPGKCDGWCERGSYVMVMVWTWLLVSFHLATGNNYKMFRPRRSSSVTNCFVTDEDLRSRNVL